MRIILAPSADLAKTLKAHITVEAEYGSFVAEGSLYTAAHHQPEMKGRPAPCNDTNIPLCPQDGIILVSHLDLDTVGGCLRALGQNHLFSNSFDSFWSLAQFVDLNGPHKLGQSGASEADLDRLYAYWAWHKANTPRFPRDATSNASEVIYKAGKALQAILAGVPEFIAAGQTMRESQAKLNGDTFHNVTGRVLVRVAAKKEWFCNHLYVTPAGDPLPIVVCLNTELGSITVSLADSIPGLSCRDVVQELWGMEAGGRSGIAGSPREQTMTKADLDILVARLNQ